MQPCEDGVAAPEMYCAISGDIGNSYVPSNDAGVEQLLDDLVNEMTVGATALSTGPSTCASLILAFGAAATAG